MCGTRPAPKTPPPHRPSGRLRTCALAGALAFILASAPAGLAAPDPPTSVVAAASPTNTRPSLSAWVAPAGTTGSVTYDVWAERHQADGVPDLGADVHRHVVLARAGIVVVHGDDERREGARACRQGVKRRVRHRPAAGADRTHGRHSDEPEARPELGDGREGRDHECRPVPGLPRADLAGSPTGTMFTDTALATRGSQTYTVKAVDAAGNISAASAAKAVMYDT